MTESKIPLITEVVPLYKGIYPKETVQIVYPYLRNRIDSLTPIVTRNERAPLITATERASCERREEVQEEIERRSQNNKATVQTLNDCKVAWERLVNGTAHLCTECGGNIRRDRKQAVPAAGKCKECQEKKGLRIS